MTTLGLLTTTALDPVTHPAWCDRTRCTTDPNLPLDDAVHLSKVVTIDAAITICGPLAIDVWLHQGATADDVYLVVDIPDTGAHALFPVPAAATAAGTVTELLDLTTSPTAQP